MNRVRVKIEGLRDAETACRIAELGADVIGLVFAESPRRVSVAEAGEIVRELPPWVTTVGVFVNASADEINHIIAETGIHSVQLHGDEPPALIADITRPCIKAFRVRDKGFTDEVLAFLDAAPEDTPRPTVLLDAYCPAARGGTGKTFNWQWVAEAREAGKLDAAGPIILAGGLNPDNVAEAIQAVRPWGVDTASGVESTPGVKDLDKVAAFLKAVAGG